MKLRPLALLVLGAAITALAIPPAQAHAPTKARAISATYFHTLEGGPHYNLFATVKGDAVKVRAFHGDAVATGKQKGEENGIPTWFFRDREFIRFLRMDLEFDGTAELFIRAADENGFVVKRCDLVKEPDFEYAQGICEKPF